ncbi:MAG: hypothetical protein JWN40_5595 [Phycisphaerales bacterium]|nr:hypothetical protein [Phycisphaerales bacterium]
MSRIVIAPIVEGQGDEAAVRQLLQRVWTELLGGDYAEVVKPIRRSRGSLLREDSDDLEKSIRFALLKLEQHGGGLVLVLIDAEDDCMKQGSLGPMILERALKMRSDIDISVVIANVMYETRFVAAAASLTDYLDLPEDSSVPENPEQERAGKGWIKQRIKSGKYSETADQAALTAKMDLSLCRTRSPSFDKLCRELEKRRH